MGTHNTTDKNIKTSFWESLQSEILFSKYKLTYEDFFAFMEQNYMYSMLFRGFNKLEFFNFKSIFNIEDSCYIMLLQFTKENKHGIEVSDIDELELYHLLKKELKGSINTIGPIIESRISILISTKPDKTDEKIKHDSICLGNKLLESIKNNYNISSIACIGNVKNINHIYSSFIEALSCLPYSKIDDAIHNQDINVKDNALHIDYSDAEKRMLDSLRHNKNDAYDYFSLLMNQLKPMSDCVKRNKIIEILILITHTVRIDGMNDSNYINYISDINSITLLKGDQLIEWAYNKLFHITGYVKQHNSIDYSNRIVQATKEYLEAHYNEEITLENLSEQVNISPQYFSKLIKRNTGLNFIDWLSMLRVKKARELLTNPNLTVKEVCYMVGYKDPNYFSRIFKKRMGITPSEYIKNKS